MELQQRQLHFRLAVKGKLICYLYIRKNACSSWKGVFLGESKYKEEASEYENAINFMGKYHKLRTLEQVRGIEHRIMIVREPVERLYSGYINQFLMRLGKNRQTSMHKEISQAVGKSAEKVTFNDFLTHYLFPRKDQKVDGHFWSQSSHMAEVEYNQVWLLPNLHQHATDFFGKDFADKYFLKKMNSTSQIEKYDLDCSDLPAQKLFESYVDEKRLPSLQSLVNRANRPLIEAYYADDVAIYSNAVEERK
ncbi:Sulfotransferase family protein [Vreelandella titanicae]|nr:Sulfotransferase family protein [Halomonas titanicae]